MIGVLVVGTVVEAVLIGENVLACVGVVSSSSSSAILGGCSRGASHGWRISIAYVGRSLGTLCRQERTKLRAASE